MGNDRCPRTAEQAQALAGSVLQALPIQVRPVAPISRTSSASRSSEQDCGDSRPAIPRSTLLFRQFFDPESSTYTYLIADGLTKEAVLVDPVLEQVERDLQVLKSIAVISFLKSA